MKSSFILFLAVGACILVGLGFYNYILGYRVVLNGPSIKPLYMFENCPPASVLSAGNKVHDWVHMQEVLKGPFAQNDSKLLSYIIANNVIRPPSAQPYNLVNPDTDPSMGQSRIVRHALNGLKNGFFVECGALDGELRSNTLYLEKRLGWKGLLIEGDPKNYDMLVEKHRKAWSTPACLATLPYPHQVLFEQHYNTGKISKQHVSNELEAPPGFAKVQCYPFFTLVSALNVTTVDYFSLDVEGSELDVLKTIPFDSVFIKVLSIEYIHDSGGRSAVKQFMEAYGFRLFGEVTDPRNWANDLVFINGRL